MFDTGEQIESGISSGGSYYKGGDEIGTLKEIFDYLHSLGINDFSPKTKITKLDKRGNFYIEFNTDIPYYEVLKKYNQNSYITFSIWYEKNFNLTLNSNVAKDRNFQEINYVTFENLDKTKEIIQEKLKKYNISEEHKEECMKQFEKNVVNVAKKLKKEFEQKLKLRTNEMDKLFFPNELKEPFKNKNIEIINGELCLTMSIKDPVSYDYNIKNNKSFFGKNEEGYYIGTSTELKEQHNFYSYFEREKPKKMKKIIYKTFDEFIKNAEKLFDKEVFKNSEKSEKIKNFFKVNLENLKNKSSNLTFINKYLNNFEYLNLVKKTSKNGKEFVNYKISDIILSFDPENPDMIKRWNVREKKEYPSVKSPVIYQKLAQENNFKQNKKNTRVR